MQITVPINGPVEERLKWRMNVSPILESEDVEFIDNTGKSVDVPFVGLFAGTDGAVECCSTKDEGTVVQTFASGGWHSNPVCLIKKVASGSTVTALKIMVKLA